MGEQKGSCGPRHQQGWVHQGLQAVFLRSGGLGTAKDGLASQSDGGLSVLKGEPVVPRIEQGDRRRVGLHMPPLYKVEIGTCLTSVTCILALNGQ